MKRTIALLAVITLTVLVLSSSALAFGGGFGGGYGGSQGGTCLRLSPDLSEEQQGQFDLIITEFRDKMAQVREQLVAARNSGDSEAFETARAERFELMEEKRETLAELLPDEFADRFQGCGGGMRNFGAKGNSF
jgi:Spy/CpxP family protein refolding chaperone